MRLSLDGAPAASIVTAGALSPVADFAVSELVRYIEVISSARLPVGPSAVAGLRPIHVGPRAAIGPLIDLPKPKKGFDGYVLRVDETEAVIAGENDRGVLYAVYDLLERIGCRWFYPQHDPNDVEIVPALATIDLVPFVVAEASGFELRVAHLGSMLFNLSPSLALAQTDWAAKARYNILAFLQAGSSSTMPAQVLAEFEALPAPVGAASHFNTATNAYRASGVVDEMAKRGLLLEGPLHCGYNFLPNELFDEHPDWFGMMADGTRSRQFPLGPEFCWSNPDAVEAFAANVVAWIAEFPFVDIFAFTPNDGGRPWESASP